MIDLNGRVIAITGSSRGIGFSIAKIFAQSGASLIMNAKNDNNVFKESCDEIRDLFNVPVIACPGDVGDPKTAQNIAKEAFSNFRSLDVMVNNAGITHLPNSMENISEAEFDKIFAVNSKSVFFSAKYLVPKMTSIGGGNILNVASTAGISPRPNLSWYNATKGWMISATKAMAIELASKRIRVNALAPVAGETPLLKSFMGGDTPEKREKFLSTIPIGRFSTPNDMGNAACFLCSEEASMITGVVLQVDGGRCI